MGDPQSALRCPGIQNVSLLMLPLPSSLVCAQLGPVQKYQGLASLSDLPCCSKFKMKSSLKKKKAKNPLLPTLFALPAPNHPLTQFHSPEANLLVFPEIIFNVCNTINAVLFRVAYGYGYGLPQNPKTVSPRIFITTISKL